MRWRGFLDVAVEHRGVGAQAQLVRLAVDAEPFVGVGLVFANLVAHLGMEDLGAAAGQAAEARVLELGQRSRVVRPVSRANQSHSTAVYAFRCRRGWAWWMMRMMFRYHS